MNALEPVGPQAALIAAETWYLLAVMTAVFVLTMGALAIALLRRREPQPPSRSVVSIMGGLTGSRRALKGRSDALRSDCGRD